MNRQVNIRFAEPEKDAAAILAIYAPYIEKTAVTFETAVPDEAAFETRMKGIAAHFPYLVMELDGEMIGYAYAHRQAERAAFAWNAELSIYFKEGYTGRGLGRPFYVLLEELLAMQGYINFYGVITGSNAGSIAMHERMGYAIIGRHEHTGFKFGQWHDTVWLHRRVHDGAPGEIMPIHAVDQALVREKIENTRKKIEKRLHM